MGSLVSCIRKKWEARKYARDIRKLLDIDQDINVAERKVVDRMEQIQTQIDTCKRVMNDTIRAPMEQKREPTMDELLSYQANTRQLAKQTRNLRIERSKLNNFQGMRDLVDDQRNSADTASVDMAKLADKLEKMNSNPAQQAKEAAKRDMNTARIITQKREARAVMDMGIGAEAITEALEVDIIDEEEAEEVVSAKPDALASIRAKFAQANLEALDHELVGLPMPIPLRPTLITVAPALLQHKPDQRESYDVRPAVQTKTKGGMKYEQLDHESSMEL